MGVLLSSTCLERWGLFALTWPTQPIVRKYDMPGFLLYQALCGVFLVKLFVHVQLRLNTAMETDSP